MNKREKQEMREKEYIKKKGNMFVPCITATFLLLCALEALGNANHTPKRSCLGEARAVSGSGVYAEEFIFEPARKIETTIGNKSQTRISFGTYGIKEVVGDSNKYSMIHDSLGMSIFIIPKVRSGERIDLTLISNGGKTQDISLLVQDAAGKVILINERERETGYEGRRKNTEKTKALLDRKGEECFGLEKFKEAKQMLGRMILRSKSKYDVTSLEQDAVSLGRKRCLPGRTHQRIGVGKNTGVLVGEMLTGNLQNIEKNVSNDALEFVETHIYGYRQAGIKGIVFEIRNKTKKPVETSERLLEGIFARTMLTFVDSSIVLPKGCVYGFVVVGDKEPGEEV